MQRLNIPHSPPQLQNSSSIQREVPDPLEFLLWSYNTGMESPQENTIQCIVTDKYQAQCWVLLASGDEKSFLADWFDCGPLRDNSSLSLN